MAATNGTSKVEDLEQNISSFPSEKNPSFADSKLLRPACKMSAIRKLLVGLVVLSLLTLSLVSAVPSRKFPLAPHKPSAEDRRKFQELLGSVETTCLHDLLHRFVSDKYKHGVFEEDKKAVAAVYEQDAAQASSLVELAKRQTSNTTTAETSPATSTTVVVETTGVSVTSTVVSTIPASTVETTATSTAASTQATTPATTQQASSSAPVTTSQQASSTVVASTAQATTVVTQGSTVIVSASTVVSTEEPTATATGTLMVVKVILLTSSFPSSSLKTSMPP